MRKLNHQFEAQVWYDPEKKTPALGAPVWMVVESDKDLNVLSIIQGRFLKVIADWPPRFMTYEGKLFAGKVLAWTTWSPEYLFEPVDVHAPIHGIVKETNRGGKNTWN